MVLGELWDVNRNMTACLVAVQFSFNKRQNSIV